MFHGLFDFDDGAFIMQTSGNMGIDSDGDLHMRMGDHMSMDLDSGEIHMTSGWNDDDDNDLFDNDLDNDLWEDDFWDD